MMKDIIIAILVGVLLSILFLNSPREGKWYDCTWAEISPDIPPKVKDECRKIRSRKST